MTDYAIPRANAPIAGNDPPTTQWYNFIRFLDARTSSADGDVQTEITSIAFKLGSPDGTVNNIPPLGGLSQVMGYDSIAYNGAKIVQLHLVNDVQTPGNTQYYGSNDSAKKGWYAVADTLGDSDNIVKTTDASGVTSFDLTDVTVAAGGALQKLAFDAKGRLSEQDAATTSDLAEGVTNLYFTEPRVLATTLAGLSTATATPVVATDSILIGIGKLQGQVAANATAIAGKEPSITGGTTSQYWRGDKTWQTLDKTAVGLANVDNTSDVNKPVSTPQQTALNLKQNISGLGTAAFVNTGNNVIGALPLVLASADGSGRAELNIAGVSARANLALTYAGTDGNGVSCGTLCIYGGATTSGSILGDIRLGLFSFDTNSATANARSGLFRISTRNDGVNGLLVNSLVVTPASVRPGSDNTQTLGESSTRWSIVYAATGSINTSDAREKTAVTPLTDAELAAAADLARSIGTYQWLSMVTEKGADVARHHAGLTVQRAIEIMQSHNLDPMRYGFICYDAWDELPEVVNSWPAQDAVLDDDGNVVTPAVEAGSEITQAYRAAAGRYSFRPDELLMFMARGFAARLDALEAK